MFNNVLAALAGIELKKLFQTTPEPVHGIPLDTLQSLLHVATQILTKISAAFSIALNALIEHDVDFRPDKKQQPSAFSGH